MRAGQRRAFLAAIFVLGGGCGSSHASTTPADAELDWVVATINSGDAVTEPLGSHFTADYLSAHPPSGLATALLSLHDKLGPVAVISDDLPRAPDRVLVRVEDRNQRWLRIGLATEPGGTRMTALSIAPNGDIDPALQTWPAVLAGIGALSTETSFTAATLSPTGCGPLQELASTRERQIGSNLKLYVLDALATDIAAGNRAWSDVIPIRDDWKSLSPLELEPAGTPHTITDLAERMISASDNTAADHLIHTLGRDKIEAAVTRSGHAAPALMTPFMTTWEWLWLVLLATPDQAHAYVSADVPGKRAFLDTIPHASTDRDMANGLIAAFTTPRMRDTVGWFASPRDLCAITAHLMRDGAAFDILLESHGLPDLRGDYAGLGYKAGSEPGVLSVSYAISRGTDNAWFFLGLVVNDETNTFDRDQAFYALGAARGLLLR